MKSVIKIFTIAAIACVVTLKTFNEQKIINVSDVVLANIEALAEPEGDATITCSAKCNDGIGKCWVRSAGEFCVFSGSEADNCTGLGCKLSDGSIYY